ncbi:MAG: tyrosine-type recombinase/integrase [Planctomycetota bacterium]|jgi:integrase
MNDEPKVWIVKYQRKDSKTTYTLRWICPISHKLKRRKIGTDSKHAQCEAAKLEDELRKGTYQELRPITWDDFVEEHIAKIPGKGNAKEARITLDEFGAQFNVPPRLVRFGMIEEFADTYANKGNSQGTVNKKLRYLRAAFKKAIKRGYIIRNPMDGWTWAREGKKTLRILSNDEETALLKGAKKLYGFKMEAFIQTALGTGGRCGELYNLTWDRIDLDNRTVLFTETKDKDDREVSITPELASILQRLYVQTQKDGGPFTDLETKMQIRWRYLLKKAEITHVTLHDLRRTYVTRMISAGVPLPTVKEMVGHSAIQTTLRHYNEVSEDDKREAVEKLRKYHGAG